MSADFDSPEVPEAQSAPETPDIPIPESESVEFTVAAEAPSRKRGRTVTLTALWLASALAAGAGTGFGILKATDHHTSGTATASTPQPTPTPTITSGVRSDGTHYGSILDFMLPVPEGFRPGPDDSSLGNDSAITAGELDAQLSEIFPQLQQSDLTSAKGVMESAHMIGGALRTYASTENDLDVELSVLQLDPAMAAKATADFSRIVDQSGVYRLGPSIAGFANAHCVLPPIRPGDKIDQMMCLGTVGDTFVIGVASGIVPMNQQAVVDLVSQQLELLKKGPTAK